MPHLRPQRRALLTGALAALALAVPATPAGAAVTLSDCPRTGPKAERPPASAQCGTVPVPLDHSGSVAGTVPVAIAKLPVLGSDESFCASDGLAAFLSGKPVRPCARQAGRVRVVPFLPASITDLRPAPGTHGTPGRIATAVRLTVGHVRRLLPSTENVEESGRRVLGLRGGIAAAPSGADAAVYALDRYQVIRGVRLSGSNSGRRLTLTAPGGITGTLALEDDGTARGTIGGQAVRFALD